MYNLYTLKNGLRVVTEKNTGVNSISVGVMIKNGSRNETEDINGISHFIEHMFFKGTNKRNAKQIAETIENLGGQINAFTSKEATCYYIKNLYTHLDTSLEVLSDMIINSKFDEEDIEKEKSVVIEEINMNNDNPEEVLYDLHSKVSFKGDMLQYPILGTPEKVKNITRDKIIDFINQKYTPSNSVISVCGKFDDKELADLIEKYFGAWENKTNFVAKYNNISIKEGSDYINKEIEQLHIALGLKGLPYNHENGYALVLLSNILGGGASSYLFQKIREQLGLCYTIYCYPQTFEGTGGIEIYAGLGKDYGEKALEAINEELELFVKNGITKEQLDINKEKIKASYILGLESTSSKMFGNAKSVLLRGRIQTEEDVIKKIDQMNMDNIDFVMKECFGKGIINISCVGPNVDMSKYDKIVLNTTNAFKKVNNHKQI